MREYVISILAVSAVIALGMLVSYRENDKTAKLAFSVILAAAVLLPLSDAIAELVASAPSLPSFDAQGTTGEYVGEAEEAFCEGVEAAVAEEFSISRENIRAFCTGFDFERMRCECVSVRLFGGAVFANIEEIERFLKNGLGGCEVEIIIG